MNPDDAIPLPELEAELWRLRHINLGEYDEVVKQAIKARIAALKHTVRKRKAKNWKEQA